MAASAFDLGQEVVNFARDFGGDPTGVADSSAAWQACLSFANQQVSAGIGQSLPLSRRKIFVPPGTYKIVTGPTLATANLDIEGGGRENTRFVLSAGQNLLNVTGSVTQLSLRNITVQAGAGAIYHTSSGSNVTGLFIVEDCSFYDYTVCAIGSTATDMPYWKVSRCLFQGTAALTSIGIALAGLTDDCSFEDCAFQCNRYHLKLGQGGNNAQIDKNAFLRFHAGSNAPILVDVWIVPAPTFQNAGPGLVMRDNKFGNEGLSTGDIRVLLADSGSGTNFVTQYHATTLSAGFCEGPQMRDNLVNGVAGMTTPVVLSYTPNFRNWQISDQYGGGDYVGIVGFDATVTLTDDRTSENSVFTLDGVLQPFEVETPPYATPPSLGVLHDGFGLNAGYSHHRNEFESGFDAGYSFLSGTPSMLVNGMTTSSAALTPATDLVGDSNAAIVTYSSGAGFIFGATTALVAGRMAFVEIDVQVGASVPLLGIRLELQNQATSAVAFRRFINAPAAGQTVSFSFVPRNSGVYNFVIYPQGYAGGTATKVIVGRPRITQGSERVHPGAAYLQASVSYTPGAVLAGATVQSTLTVQGAQVGDFVLISTQPGALTPIGFVTAANTVTFTLWNPTGGTVTLGASTITARVFRRRG